MKALGENNKTAKNIKQLIKRITEVKVSVKKTAEGYLITFAGETPSKEKINTIVLFLDSNIFRVNPSQYTKLAFWAIEKEDGTKYYKNLKSLAEEEGLNYASIYNEIVRYKRAET